MAEWLYEDGIGEARALMLDGGRPVAMRIERPSAVRAGTVRDHAKLVKKLGARGLVEVECGMQMLLAPLPKGATEGQKLRVEVTREPMRERGRLKLGLVRQTDEAKRDGPVLRERILGDHAVRVVRAAGAETLDDHGWLDLFEQARQGLVPFAGGSLRIESTSAFIAIDVDGDLPPRELAFAAAPEVARAIRLFDLQGSISVDFPTLPAKADRARISELFDEAAAFDCERTAVNGFGLLQIVRRRVRASVVEELQGNDIASAALALLRIGERSGGRGQLMLSAAPAVIDRLERRFHLVEELAQRIGRPVVMESDPARGLWQGEAVNEVET